MCSSWRQGAGSHCLMRRAPSQAAQTASCHSAEFRDSKLGRRCPTHQLHLPLKMRFGHPEGTSNEILKIPGISEFGIEANRNANQKAYPGISWKSIPNGQFWVILLGGREAPKLTSWARGAGAMKVHLRVLLTMADTQPKIHSLWPGRVLWDSVDLQRNYPLTLHPQRVWPDTCVFQMF